MKQLDLFDVRMHAQVYVFPPARRMDLVRTAVAGLLDRDYAGGKRFWTQHTRDLTRNLRDAGVKRDEIQRLLPTTPSQCAYTSIKPVIGRGHDDAGAARAR
jgi:hypothetical protein